jgi:hypothetical protein
MEQGGVNWDGGLEYSRVVKYLPSIHKALCSIFSTKK